MAQALLVQSQYAQLIARFGDIELKTPAAQANLKTSLAAAFALEGEAEASQAALATALAADPTYAPALMVQARAKAAAGDADGALSVLDSIIKRAPGSQEAWQLKGDVLSRRKGQADAALAAYRKVLEIKPGLKAGHVGVLTVLFEKGDLEGAAAQIEKLKTQYPNDVQARRFETLLAFERKNYQAASELSKQLLALAPNDPRSMQLAGTIALQHDDLPQAQDLLERTVKAAPHGRVGRQLLVTTYLRSGQTAKALSTLQPMLAAGEPDAATSALAGDVYRRSGDLAKARIYFARAAKLTPDNARARTSLALADLASGQSEQAFDQLREVSTANTDVTADLALFAIHLLHKDFAAANQAIDALEKKLPGKPVAARLRGRLLLLQDDLVGARKSFEQALAIDAGYFPAVDALASIDMLEGKPQDASHRIEAVLVKDPKNVPALRALATQRALSGAPKDEVAALLERAVAARPSAVSTRLALVELHLVNKDSAKAVAAAQDGLATDPSNALLLDALGRSQLASGDQQQALRTFTKAAGLQPPSALPHMRLAQAHLSAHDTAAAATSLRKALQIKPDLLEAQTMLMDLDIAGKDYAAARELARAVQSQRPRESIGYLLEADQAISQKRFDDALTVLRAGLKATPAPELAKKTHTTLTMAGRHDEAERFAAAWIRDQPRDAVFRLYMGDFAAARSDLPGAEKMYAAASQARPASALALNNLAWVSGQLGPSTAIGYAERALVLAPAYAEAMDTLAMLLSAKGDYTKALEWENKALALQPENGQMKLNLAKIHARGGNKVLARQQLEQLARLGEKFPAQAEVARLLKTLSEG